MRTPAMLWAMAETMARFLGPEVQINATGKRKAFAIPNAKNAAERSS